MRWNRIGLLLLSSEERYCDANILGERLRERLWPYLRDEHFVLRWNRVGLFGPSAQLGRWALTINELELGHCERS